MKKKIVVTKSFIHLPLNMRNKVLLIFIIFLLGITQGTKATNIVPPDHYEEPTLLVSKSLEGEYYNEGINKKQPNFSGSFTKTNITPNQFRETGPDYFHNYHYHPFAILYYAPYKLFISLELDIYRTALPIFKLYNNYRL